MQNSHLSTESQTSKANDKEKRHSFTGLPKPHHSANNHNRLVHLHTIWYKVFLLNFSWFRHSAEILSGEGHIISSSHSQQSDRSVRSAPAHTVPIHDIQLPATYVALYPYKPQKADELELKKGSIYIVTER